MTKLPRFILCLFCICFAWSSRSALGGETLAKTIYKLPLMSAKDVFSKNDIERYVKVTKRFQSLSTNNQKKVLKEYFRILSKDADVHGFLASDNPPIPYVSQLGVILIIGYEIENKPEIRFVFTGSPPEGTKNPIWPFILKERELVMIAGFENPKLAGNELFSFQGLVMSIVKNCEKRDLSEISIRPKE